MATLVLEVAGFYAGPNEDMIGPMTSRTLHVARSAGLVLLLLSGCTLHHVRDERPVSISIAGEPATLSVETADSARGGERILVTVEHRKNIDFEGSIGGQAELATPKGDPIDPCRRQSLTRVDLESSDVTTHRVRSQALFSCRWPLTQPVSVAIGESLVPVLEPSGLSVMGERPWLMSGWVKAELGARVTGQPFTQGRDFGVNVGARGLLLSHIGFGGRSDILIDSQHGGGEFLIGPEFAFVHSMWPCSRCSLDASLSYEVGYTRGFAHGPEADLRFGFRMARTAESWHGAEVGIGYRHLIGPDSGGSVIFTLSYTLQKALRAGLPAALRAQPRTLLPEDPVTPRLDDDLKEGEEPPSVSLDESNGSGSTRQLQPRRS